MGISGKRGNSGNPLCLKGSKRLSFAIEISSSLYLQIKQNVKLVQISNVENRKTEFIREV